MPRFEYKAVQDNSDIITGELEAATKSEAISELKKTGLTPIHLAESSVLDNARLPYKARNGRKGGRIKERDIMLFTTQLSSMLSSGLKLDRSLGALAGLADKRSMREMILAMKRDIEEGASLSEAMARHPKAFSDLYVNMVKAGEAGGVVENVLERLSGFLEEEYEIKSFVRASLIYPIIMIFLCIAALVVVTTVVMPRFVTIFSSVGESLPLPTLILLKLSGFMSSYWWTIPVAVGLIALYFIYLNSNPEGRMALDRRKLSLPVFGDLIMKRATARFARTLSTLLAGGVPLIRALNITKDVLGNRILAQAVTEVCTNVKEGASISGYLRRQGLFHPLIIQMIEIGEETGRLDEMLSKAAATFEVETKATIRTLMSLLEPALILIIAGIVSFTAAAMLLPIIDFNRMIM